MKKIKNILMNFINKKMHETNFFYIEKVLLFFIRCFFKSVYLALIILSCFSIILIKIIRRFVFRYIDFIVDKLTIYSNTEDYLWSFYYKFQFIIEDIQYNIKKKKHIKLYKSFKFFIVLECFRFFYTICKRILFPYGNFMFIIYVFVIYILKSYILFIWKFLYYWFFFVLIGLLISFVKFCKNFFLYKFSILWNFYLGKTQIAWIFESWILLEKFYNFKYLIRHNFDVFWNNFYVQIESLDFYYLKYDIISNLLYYISFKWVYIKEFLFFYAIQNFFIYFIFFIFYFLYYLYAYFGFYGLLFIFFCCLYYDLKKNYNRTYMQFYTILINFCISFKNKENVFKIFKKVFVDFFNVYANYRLRKKHNVQTREELIDDLERYKIRKKKPKKIDLKKADDEKKNVKIAPTVRIRGAVIAHSGMTPYVYDQEDDYDRMVARKENPVEAEIKEQKLKEQREKRREERKNFGKK